MNQHLVVAVVVIGGVTIWHHLALGGGLEPGSTSTVTSISVGAFIFLGVLALADMAPGLSPITGGLAMLAMLVVLLNDLPNLLNTINFNGPTAAPPPSNRGGPH